MSASMRFAYRKMIRFQLSSIEAPSTYYLRGIDGDRDVTGSCITGYDVTVSCITGSCVTGSREPEMKGR